MLLAKDERVLGEIWDADGMLLEYGRKLNKRMRRRRVFLDSMGGTIMLQAENRKVVRV
jgi:hypothetical protein